jgi:glycosyltransferase involved in cell wall biosynthesis
MKISVIVSYYKNLSNLALILKALNNQSFLDFEVIISEDDNNEETLSFFNKNKEKYSFPLIHVHQNVDLGFRKNIMLNKSIKKSKGETLVFIDGDCIPHKHFVKAYNEYTEDNFMLKGRRVMLGEKITNKILKEKSITYLNLISILFSDSKRKKEAVYTSDYSLITTKKIKAY